MQLMRTIKREKEIKLSLTKGSVQMRGFVDLESSVGCTNALGDNFSDYGFFTFEPARSATSSVQYFKRGINLIHDLQ